MRILRFIISFISFCFILTFLIACAPKQSTSQVQTSKSNQSSLSYEQLLDQGRALINDRRHTKALEVLDQAGQLELKRPEWLYEKARAFFAMDEFEQSAGTCRQALNLDPSFYDALDLSWAARMEADNASDTIKQTVRQEIETLLQQSGSNAGALKSAYQGYNYLKHRRAGNDHL